MVGKLRLSEWTSKAGERRSKVQVVADAVQFLGSPKKPGEADGGVAELADKPPVRIDGLEAENDRLRTALAKQSGATA